MRYIIDGDPTPLARPRFTNHHVFDNQKQLKFAAALQIQHQHIGQPMFSGPIHFDITFFFKPAQKSKKLIGQYRPIKPDLDNCIKFILDVCSGIIYDNDCIVSSITAKKVYDLKPRTEFEITKL